MHAILATLSVQTSRRITEVGALLGLIGGVVVAVAALPSARKWGLVVGGLLVAVGFGLIIVAIHFGLSPYHVK